MRQAGRSSPSGRSATATRAACAGPRALHLGEGAHIAHDAVEEVLAAHEQERLGVGGVERYAQLVEAGVDQRLLFFGVSSVPLVLNST